MMTMRRPYPSKPLQNGISTGWLGRIALLLLVPPYASCSLQDTDSLQSGPDNAGGTGGVDQGNAGSGQCSTDEDCVELGDTAAGSVCVEAACVQCSTDEDCVELGDAAAGSVCVEAACVQCSSDEDCVELGGGVCAESACVQCSSDEDCVELGGGVCAESACVQCSTDEDCVALGGAAAGSVCAESACVQCSTNEDCVELGDEAAGSVCAESACVQCSTAADCAALGPEFDGGGCVDSVCQLAAKWACSEVPPAQATQEQLETTVTLFNVSTFLPEAGVHVSLCTTLDLPCQTPRDETETDAEGIATLTLPAGHTGYLAFESEAIEPQLFFPTLPIAEGETLGMAFVNPDGALEALGDMLGATVDPERGLGVVMIYDCQGVAAPGVTVEFDGNLQGTELYYALGGIPTTPANGATFTDDTGVAGLFNAPLGTLAFTVRIGSRTLGRSQMMIRRGFMSFAPLQLGRGLYVE